MGMPFIPPEFFLLFFFLIMEHHEKGRSYELFGRFKLIYYSNCMRILTLELTCLVGVVVFEFIKH